MSISSENETFKNCSLNTGSSLLYFLDLFGKNLNIKISGKEKQTTLTGSILGILSIIAIITFSYNFIIDLIFRTNVKIMYKQERDMVPLNNLTDTPIVFAIVDGEAKPIDKRLYDINVMWMSYNLNYSEDGSTKEDCKSVNIPYTKCDINNSFGEHKNLFKNAPNMEELYCIPPNSFNFTLFGKYADLFNGYSYLNLYVNKCKNKTENDKICLSTEEIDNKLSNVYFTIISLDSEIDHYNSSQTHHKVIKINSFLMSSKIHKRYYYYIRQVIYNTDYGFAIENTQNEIFYQQDNYQFEDKLPDNTITSTSPSDVGTFSIVNENKVDTYYRSYEKIQDIIADVGGVVELILLFASIINYILTRNYSTLQIINSIFDFEEPENENLNFQNFKSHFLGAHNNHSLYSSKDHFSSNLNVLNHNISNNEQYKPSNKNSHSKILSNGKFHFEKKENSNIKKLPSDIR